MKQIASLLLAVAALLLPSCTGWQLGECLRAPYATYTGLDIERPADGNIYHRPAGGTELCETCYVLAPESTYNIDPPVLYDASGLYPKPRKEACNLRPTGRVVPVCLKRDGEGNYQLESALAALPKGLVAEDAAISPQLAQARENARQAGNRQYTLPTEDGGKPVPQLTQPGLGRRLAIGSCDYLVDPLLSIATLPVELAWNILTLPYAIIETATTD